MNIASIKITFQDKIAFFVLVTCGIIILNPWQLNLHNNKLNSVYYIFLFSIISVLSMYFFIRLKQSHYKLKWIIKICFILIGLVGLLSIIWHTNFYGLPSEKKSYVLYQNKNNPNYRVLHIYYKGFLPTQGHWELKKVLEYPEYNFRLERNFNPKSLNGLWQVYDRDNNYTYKGDYDFKDGKKCN